MKNNERSPVVITQEDFDLIKSLLGGIADDNDEMSLGYELNRAVIVTEEKMPADVIRLNSEVSILDTETQLTTTFTIVLPKQADIHLKKISVLTPMGAALIGFKKGEEVEWKVPAGLKRFKILEVKNA